MYQSNLYGIEIGTGDVGNITFAGINRTFMELKSITEVSPVSVNVYQSNLYGIEIGYSYHQRNGTGEYQSNLYGIEITLPTPRRCGSQPYQSNLYGIEIGSTSRADAMRSRVSIEPLWNWNSATFFTLLMMRFVSIEPLWNWNCSSTS